VIHRGVRVAGFDDSSIATDVRPMLTTIQQPLVELGRRMADLLINALAGAGPVKSGILPTSLVPGESTAISARR